MLPTQTDVESPYGKDPADLTKLSEQIARSVTKALLSYLDLLATSGFVKLGLRATLHTENVSNILEVSINCPVVIVLTCPVVQIAYSTTFIF